MSDFPGKGKVAVLKTQPSTVLADYARVMELAGVRQALPPACRAAFVLHDVEGFGHQEVGDALGISEGTSKSQVHKARMRIRAFLLRSAPAVREVAR